MSVSIEVMRASDDAAVAKLTSKALMERAGRALADCIDTACRACGLKKIVFFNGKGNNGGDGYVAAAILRGNGYEPIVYGDEPKSDDCKYYAERYRSLINNCIARDADNIIEPIKPLLGCIHDLDSVLRGVVIVDCIFGTGIKGVLSNDYAEIIGAINKIVYESNLSGGIRENYVISCDMPSGLTDNGRAALAIKADKTLAIAADKDAYYLNDGKDYTGVIEIADIGIDIIGEEHILTVDALIEEVYPPRKKNSHKGNYGTVGIVGCSENYVGAGKLSYVAAVNTLGECAMRGGAGLVRLYVPQIMKPYFWTIAESCSLGGCKEELRADTLVYGIGNARASTDAKPTDSGDKHTDKLIKECKNFNNDNSTVSNVSPYHNDKSLIFNINITINSDNFGINPEISNFGDNYDLDNNEIGLLTAESNRVLNCVKSQTDLQAENVFAYGMGAGEGDADLLRRIIASKAIALIDADGLNLLSRNIELLENLPDGKTVILTPHVKEMSRLSGKSIDEILNDPITAAKDFALKYSVIVVLKGSGSVITDGKTVYLNAVGSPCLAKGGSGDVLSGIIAALAAKGADPLKAAAAGAYILGKASEAAAERFGENSTLPRDIAAAIKSVIHR